LIFTFYFFWLNEEIFRTASITLFSFVIVVVDVVHLMNEIKQKKKVNDDDD